MKRNSRVSMPEKSVRDQRRRKFIEQKLMGLGIIAISVVLICIASTGTTVEERDVTAVLLTLPLGLLMLFSKEIIIV